MNNEYMCLTPAGIVREEKRSTLTFADLCNGPTLSKSVIEHLLAKSDILSIFGGLYKSMSEPYVQTKTNFEFRIPEETKKDKELRARVNNYVTQQMVADIEKSYTMRWTRGFIDTSAV